MKICGINSVIEALKARKIQKIYYSDDSGKVREVLKLAREEKIPCYKKKMSEKICAEIVPISFSKIEEIARKAIEDRGFILILDNVNDPQNMGACIRTAEFFGCSGIIIKKRRSVGITEGVIRASAGAVFHIKIATVENLVNVVKKLKKFEFFTVGAEVDGKELWKVRISSPVVLIVGGEDKGISSGVKNLCDDIVKIPGVGRMKSLNLSVACGIIIFEIFKNVNISNV
ncbi:MAG: 23S rRNA (guanosine(2251)-2'-O)-methyltransferase RlmB [Archaeoglobaceae archaeon]|nr:23S rRNA (guanosine(2251)-2'-O)-methyltransferase RlmB [Archaeoglobaceae archaeon]MDW7990362.1 23S rRNA (guanosine(2251)-2'-O)-methyltransferase RlmB [Archaeoglobaceae archaeon]